MAHQSTYSCIRESIDFLVVAMTFLTNHTATVQIKFACYQKLELSAVFLRDPKPVDRNSEKHKEIWITNLSKNMPKYLPDVLFALPWTPQSTRGIWV